MGAEPHVLQMQYLAEPMELLCSGGSCEHHSDSSDIISNNDEPCNLPEMMAAVTVLLEGLGEDATRDGLLRTPLRVAKAFRDATIGYQQSAQEVVQSAMFEEAAAAGGKGNGGGLGGMVVVRNIEVYAICEGCLLPFRLRCHVGYIPSQERVVGLSKLARVAEIYAKRLQSPQRFVDELAQAFIDTLKPSGVAVVSESWHMQWPGASENRISAESSKETVGWTHSTVCARRGQFQDKAARDLLWTEFMGILALEGTTVKYPCAADTNGTPHGRGGPQHSCPFSVFDAHFLTSIGSQDSVPSEPLASNGHEEPQPRPNGVRAQTTHRPNMIEAVQNLLRLVGDDPSRTQLRMTPWRFVGWLWTSTQGSRSPVPDVNYLEFHSSLNGTNTVGTNGLNSTHLNGGGLTVATNDRGVGNILGELDLSFQSQCEHHLLPFLGVIHVGYLVGGQEVRRLDSKSLQRIVKNYSSRFQVQERLTRQIAEAVGGSVMVVVEAVHMCMLSRGVQQHASDTVTYASLGVFASDVLARNAFLQLISAQRACK